jgi:hypothetical protein
MPYVDWKELNTENEDDVRLWLKLYGFGITVEQLKALLQYKWEKTLKTGYSYSETLSVVRAEKIIENERGTLHLVVWSNGKFSLFNKNVSPQGIPMLHVSWGYNKNEVFEDLEEGEYVIFVETWREWYLAVLTKCTSEQDVFQWLEEYNKCLGLLKKYAEYQEFANCREVERGAIVRIDDLQRQYKKMERTAKQIDELEQKEEEKKNEAMKKITTVDNRIHIEALDGRVYDIEIHSDWRPETETFLPYVYRHRYHWTAEHQQDAKQESFFRELYEDLIDAAKDFSISVDGKPAVRITKKVIMTKKGEVNFLYFDNKRVSAEHALSALYDYFIRGQQLNSPIVRERVEKQQRLDFQKQREEMLKTQGITGYITDLEGEIPVTLMFEREGNNWYLVLGSKRTCVKGGIETIQSLEKVLTGKALTYDDRHSTVAFYRRLAEAVGEEEAGEIVKEVKNMGQLLRVLKTREGGQ